MSYVLKSACICSKGSVRRHNEDHFCFNGLCPEMGRGDLQEPAVMEGRLKKPVCMAVFDGMGGERFGDLASWTAARRMEELLSAGTQTKEPSAFLENMIQDLNTAVSDQAGKLLTSHMGSTAAGLLFCCGSAFSFNLGDSRVYRMREGKLQQLSRDHVHTAGGQTFGKAPLSQYLGMNPQELIPEPFIREEPLQDQDVFLICTDGLTDMVDSETIAELLRRNQNPQDSVRELLNRALDAGGKDNITIISVKAEKTGLLPFLHMGKRNL